jgi:transposase
MSASGLHRLETHGARDYVIDPASVQVDRRARRAKMDNIDTGRLLRSLMADLRGEPKVLSVVRVPSFGAEEGRRLPISGVISRAQLAQPLG